MERAQSQDRGEQSLLELRRPQPAGAPSRGVAGNNQPSMDAETEIVRARAPPPREQPSGAPHGDDTDQVHGNHHHGRPFVATALTLLVVPALYALWFRVRSDETIDAPAFHPQRMESFDGHLEPIRIAAQ